MLDKTGRSIFGAIEQRVVKYEVSGSRDHGNLRVVPET
jgi:hypothetical protein